MEKNNKKEIYSFNRLLWAAMAAVTITVMLILLVFQVYLKQFQGDNNAENYSLYYVMIVEDRKSDFWRGIYESAYEAGLEQDIYVDLLGDNLSQNYSKLELMKIATYADVDGIIIEADESLRMTEAINTATDAGIPVITLYTDNTQSKRSSYVGISNYDIGREYGRQVLKIANRKRESQDVLVLMDANSGDTSQNIVWSGIQETIMQGNDNEEIHFNMYMAAIDDSNTFTVEESIRDLFMQEEVPDIIICLNELNTSCVYQAVVDYNKVGEVSILGYYNSDTILKGIFRSVIDATISVDVEQMGRYCVDALTEYKALGNTSDYFAVDITLIDKDNVSEYMGGMEDDKK